MRWLQDCPIDGSLHAPPDDLANILRDKPDAIGKIEAHLKSIDLASVMNDYFCSQFVAKLVSWIGLTDCPTTVTPCGLFDLLKANEWNDVTEIDCGDHA